MNEYRSAESMSVEGLIGLQRTLSLSRNPFERVIGALCVAGILKARLAVLPDEAVGQLMVDHVTELNLLGPESVIVEVASERLREGTAITPMAVQVEKCETSLVCPECGAELWRMDE